MASPDVDRSEALESAYRAHSGALRVFVSSHTFDNDAADELVSRAFAELADQEQLPDEVQEWLEAHVRAGLGTYFRRSSVPETQAYGIQPPSTSLSPWNVPEDLLPERDLRDDVADAIALLPEREKLVIALLHYEELTEREIGEVLGVTEDRIAALHARALQSLAATLDIRERGAGPQPTVLTPDGAEVPPDSAERRAWDLVVTEVDEELIRRLATNSKLLYELAPRKFEELVAELYRRRGYEATLTPASGDGGVDIWVVRKDELGSSLVAVQCKRHAPDHKVGVALVRELTGTLYDSKAGSAVLMTTSFFTRGAREFEHRHQYRLALHDYYAVQELLNLPRAPSRRLDMALPNARRSRARSDGGDS